MGKLRNIYLYLPSSTCILEFCLFCLPSFYPLFASLERGKVKSRKNTLLCLLFVPGQRGIRHQEGEASLIPQASGRSGGRTSVHGTMGIADGFWLFTGLESQLGKVEPVLDCWVWRLEQGEDGGLCVPARPEPAAGMDRRPALSRDDTVAHPVDVADPNRAASKAGTAWPLSQLSGPLSALSETPTSTLEHPEMLSRKFHPATQLPFQQQHGQREALGER